jgi:hypothetical protein
MKELGFKQKSLFSYKTYIIKEHNTEPPEIFYHHGNVKRKKEQYATNLQYVSAYTVAELGEMLPHECESDLVVKNYYGISGWTCFISYTDMDLLSKGNIRGERWYSSKNEADARAKMLIYLKENNLI